MKKRSVAGWLIAFTTIAISATAQQPTDSLKQEIRSYVNRNFTKTRTFNLYWEQTFDHDYTLRQNGQEIEKGKTDEVQTIKFSATIPVWSNRNLSVYANAQTDFYRFKSIKEDNDNTSCLFTRNDDGYNYYKGTASAAYRTNLFNKPLIMNATIGGDGWSGDFGKVQGTFSAIMVFRNTATSNFSAGFYARTLGEKLPVIPIIAYWHQFNRHLGIDVTLPSRIYMRYQFRDNQRLSLGASLGSDGFYLRTTAQDGLPPVGYFRKATFKPEMVYEYIINDRFFLMVRGGATGILKGGLYDKNRKGTDGDPYIKYTQPMTGFLNLGISYNLFGK